MKDSYTTLDAVAQPAGSTHGKATSEVVHLEPVPELPNLLQYRVRHGGLMRCCIQSLDQEMVRRQQAGEPLAVEGQILPCVYHADKIKPVMIYRGGCWQWVG